MSRVPVVLGAALFAAGVFAEQQRPGDAAAVAATQATARGGLRGAWKVTESSSRTPGSDWIAAVPNASLYIFTEKHYSYMFAVGPGPRRLFAGGLNKPTDAEKIGAYDSFVAASGTYVLSGATLTLNAVLHKNPHEMLGESLTYSVAIDGNTLRMTIVNPPFAPGRERRIVLTRME